VVAALLLKAAWNIMKPAVLEIMEARDMDLAKKIHDAVEARDEIHAVYDVRSRRVGGAVFVDLKMIVDPDMSIAAVHALQHDLELQVRGRHPAVLELLAHVEPGVAHYRPSL